MIIDENRANSGCLTGGDVFPAIAHHEARGEIESELGGPPQYQAGKRFTTLTTIDVIVRANQEFIDRESARERYVKSIDRIAILRASTDVGLVRYDDEYEPQSLQSSERGLCATNDDEFVDRLWRIRSSVADDRLV